MTAPSKGEMDDAWQVFREWLVNDRQAGIRFSQKLGRFLDYQDQFYAARNNVKKIPLDKVRTFADWGRRIKGARLKRPIIVFKMPGSSRYQVLDGQHRVHTLKEQGKSHVMAAVITFDSKKASEGIPDMNLRSRLIRLAHAHPELRADLLPILRTSMEHATEEARKKYLESHPKADPKRHTVKEQGKGNGKSDDSDPKLQKAIDRAAKPLRDLKRLSGMSEGEARRVHKALESLEKRLIKAKHPAAAKLNTVNARLGDFVASVSTTVRWHTPGGRVKSQKRALQSLEKHVPSLLKLMRTAALKHAAREMDLERIAKAVAKRMGGRALRIPIHRLTILKNFRDSHLVLEPYVQAAYAIKDMHATWGFTDSTLGDPEDFTDVEETGYYSALLVQARLKSNNQPVVLVYSFEQDENPLTSRKLLDEDWVKFPWQPQTIAESLTRSFEQDLQTTWEEEEEKKRWMTPRERRYEENRHLRQVQRRIDEARRRRDAEP